MVRDPNSANAHSDNNETETVLPNRTKSYYTNRFDDNVAQADAIDSINLEQFEAYNARR